MVSRRPRVSRPGAGGWLSRSPHAHAPGERPSSTPRTALTAAPLFTLLAYLRRYPCSYLHRDKNLLCDRAECQRVTRE